MHVGPLRVGVFAGLLGSKVTVAVYVPSAYYDRIREPTCRPGSRLVAVPFYGRSHFLQPGYPPPLPSTLPKFRIDPQKVAFETRSQPKRSTLQGARELPRYEKCEMSHFLVDPDPLPSPKSDLCQIFFNGNSGLRKPLRPDVRVSGHLLGVPVCRLVRGAQLRAERHPCPANTEGLEVVWAAGPRCHRRVPRFC